MKYIARCALINKICTNACAHSKEHDWKDSCPLINIHPQHICECVPLDLEYYMREIIKKYEENKNENKM